jgi:Site-specific recombinases, DNA invertase Pin homologs
MVDYFVNISECVTKLLPMERRRYVVYIRKSTDDLNRQVRSLEDQKSECLALVAALKLPPIKEEDIFEESASAKDAGNREVFDKMMLGFKTHKYHGLISWSPDRLARNMKEGGEIIECVDNADIQDLHFKTYQFDNTPNGKMLLGILFATSKQYSDRLSVDVKRGNVGKVKEGKYNGFTKKGYYVDADTWYFLPDGRNWELLRRACVMRLYERKTNVEIAQYLNDIGLYSRKFLEDEPKRVNITKKMVGDIFADKFYMGIYDSGDTVADLTEVYNFMPIMTPDEYITLNKDMSAIFDKDYVGKGAKPARLDYGLLRHKVVCDFCDETMEFQHNEIRKGKNKGKWLISFYCRNQECQRRKKEENKASGTNLKSSVRAKYIMAAIEWTIRCMTKRSKEAYQFHIDGIKAKYEQDLAIAKRKYGNAQREHSEAKKEFAKYQRFQVDDLANYKKFHNGKLEECQEKIKLAISNEEQLERKLDKLQVGLPTEQEFYELVDSYLLKLLNAGSILEQDAICNELVSNLRVGNDTVSVIKLNPPYDLLVDLDKISLGWG